MTLLKCDIISKSLTVMNILKFACEARLQAFEGRSRAETLEETRTFVSLRRGWLIQSEMAEKPGDGANVKVAVRCRPLNARYILAGSIYVN